MFEYDPTKSQANFEKHGIDFEQAQSLWDDVNITVPVKGDFNESRYAVFGVINNKHWTAIITFRNHNIRIISVRRSRKEEEIYYETKKNEIS